MSKLRIWIRKKIAKFFHIDVSDIEILYKRLSGAETDIRKLNRQVRTLQTAMEQMMRSRSIRN